LHSRIDPIELSCNPLPDTVTFCPFASPVLGVTVRLAAAQMIAGKANTPLINKIGKNRVTNFFTNLD
jgi:hypothetical protein